MPGLFILLNIRRRSVPRGGRATPVEAVDEFGGNSLFAIATVIDGVDRTRRTASTCNNSSTDLRRGAVSKVGEAILALQEQTRDPIERILGAATHEPPILALARQHKTRSRASRRVEIVHLSEIAFRPTTVDISQQSREGDVTDTTTGGPSPVILNRADLTGCNAGAATRAVEAIIPLDVRPLTVGKHANHNV